MPYFFSRYLPSAFSHDFVFFCRWQRWRRKFRAEEQDRFETQGFVLFVVVERVLSDFAGVCQAVLLGILGIAVVAVIVSLPLRITRLELFSYDSSHTEWNSAAVLQNLLNAPKMEARRYGHKVQLYDQEAAKYSAIVAKAKLDEINAEKIASEDKQELKSLRSLSRIHNSEEDMSDNDDLISTNTDSESSLNSELSDVDSKLQSLSFGPAYQPRSLSNFDSSQYTDDLRLHNIANTHDGWGIRRVLNSAREAAKRAQEANVIANNEMAIADAEARRVARLRAQQSAAQDTAARVEAHIRGAATARRAAKASAFGSAMRSYTGQLQGYVAQDMDTLGRLKHAEDSASFGPHIASGLFRQPPTPSNLPDVDPSTFMGNAPFRDEGSLADYKAKQPGAMTQLSQEGSIGDVEQGSIDRAMSQERRQLARLTRMVSGAAGGGGENARRELSGVGGSSVLAPTQALTEQTDSSFTQDSSSLAAGSAAPTSALAGQSFTSFPAGEKLPTGGVEDVSALDDGALIRDAKPAVGLVRIPLGAHEVLPAPGPPCPVPPSTFTRRVSPGTRRTPPRARRRRCQRPRRLSRTAPPRPPPSAPVPRSRSRPGLTPYPKGSVGV